MTPSGAEDRIRELLEAVWAGRMTEAEALAAGRREGIDEAALRVCFGAASTSPTAVHPLAPSAPSASASGLRVGSYEIKGEIGRGGMGVVYRARQAGLEREVALKVLVAGRDAPREQIERFLLEARAAAQLRHDNLIEIYDVGSDGDVHYFSMEYVQGKSLSEIVKSGPVPARRAATLVRDAARGLAVAHAAGIVHRDVKPSNILVGPGDRVLVADFGLAKATRQDTHLTKSGMILGTPLYMPYEQFAPSGAKLQVGPWSDVYALGATLYQVLSGRPPFDPTLDTIQLLALKDLSDPVPLRKTAPNVPRDLDTIVRKAMDRDPRRRYADAREFADDVDRFLEHQPILARPPGPLRKAYLWSRRRPALAVLVLVAFPVLAAAAGWYASEFLRERRAANACADAGALRDSGELREAVLAYERALSIAPDHGPSIEGRSRTVDLWVERIQERMRESGDVMEAADALRFLSTRLSNPTLHEKLCLATCQAEVEFYTEVLRAGRAEAAQLASAVERLETLGRELGLRREEGELADRRREAFSKSARTLLALAQVQDQGELADRIGRLLEGVGQAAALESRIEVKATDCDWSEREGQPIEAEFRTYRLPEGGWSGDQAPALKEALATPALASAFSLPSGIHLVEARAARHIPTRFVLVVPRSARLAVRIRLFEERDLGCDILPVPRVEISVEDALEPPAADGSPRDASLALLRKACAMIATPEDYFVAREELTNAEFQRLFPTPPVWAFAPTGWDREAWTYPSGEESLPLRGMNQLEAKRIARRATELLLGADLRRWGWRFSLPRYKGGTGTRERLGAGPGHDFFESAEDFAELPLLRSFLASPLRAEWPQECRGNLGSGHVAPVGTHAADVSLCGCVDLEGNVTEWMDNELPDNPFKVSGGNYALPYPSPSETVNLGPNERRPYIGLRLILIREHDSGAPTPETGEDRTPDAINQEALDLFRTKGDVLEALVLLEESLAAHPENLPSRLNASLLALAEQNWPRCKEHATLALESATGDAATLARLTRAAASIMEDRTSETGVDLSEAASDLDALLEEDPASQVLRFGRAYVRFLTGDLAGAAGDLDVAVPGLFRLTRFERQLGFDELEAAQLADNPERGFELVIGRRLVAMADVPSLSEDVIRPDFAFLERAYPSGRHHRGRSSERFQEIVQKSLRKDVVDGVVEKLRREGEPPRAALGRFAGLLAQLQALVGDRQGATAATYLVGALGGDPVDGEILRAEFALFWNDLDPAVEAFRKVLEERPGDPRALLDLAWARILVAQSSAEGLRETLHASAERAIEEASPGDPGESALYRAVLEIDRGRLEEARDILEAAPAEDAAVWLYRGRLAQQRADPAAARRCWDEATTRDRAYRPLVAFLEEGLGD